MDQSSRREIHFSRGDFAVEFAKARVFLLLQHASYSCSARVILVECMVFLQRACSSYSAFVHPVERWLFLQLVSSSCGARVFLQPASSCAFVLRHLYPSYRRCFSRISNGLKLEESVFESLYGGKITLLSL